MKTLKSLFAASLLLAALGAVATAQAASAPSRAEHWLTSYYQNPQPGELARRVHQLSREGYFEKAGQPDTAIGFFAAAFARNPEQINLWLRETADLPSAHRRVLAAAAWQAGSPRGIALLKELSAGDDAALRSEIAGLLQRGPTPIANTPVLSEASMNLQWGAFLASGDQRHILAVLTALGRGDSSLNSAARYTLAQNAAEHAAVFEICRAQLDKQPEAVRSEIRAALNEAANARQPRS